jgi:hypothetical protein
MSMPGHTREKKPSDQMGSISGHFWPFGVIGGGETADQLEKKLNPPEGDQPDR